MERKYWTLLALAAAGGKPLTPVQLQKTLFLVSRNCPDAVGGEFYDFQPYNYGPFDVSVYEDAGELAKEGLVNIDQPTGCRWNVYSCSSKGLSFATTLTEKVDPLGLAYLSKVVEWIFPLSFSQIVSAIYRAFPEMREKSIFQD